MKSRLAEDTPDVEQNVIQALRHKYDELTHSQKRIAEAIVEDPEYLAFATVDKMATRLGVSPSTIVRFTYRLGLNGYQDLQDRVRQMIRSQIRSASEGSDSKVTGRLGDTAFASSFDHDIEHLRRTISGLDLESLQASVRLLAGAKRVFVSGDMASYSVAYYTTIAFERSRGNTHLVRGEGENVGTLSDVGEDDVLLAFTFPPYATSVMRVVRWVKERGGKVIAITDSPISPAGQLVDIVLQTLASGVGPHNTLVPAMAVANAVINGVVVDSQQRALDRYATALSLAEAWDLYVLKSGDGG